MNEEQVADLDEEGSNAYKEEWNAHVVKIKGVENKFMVAIPHQADDEVAINIYDQDEQLVFSEKQKLNTDFAKVYVLKNLEGGTIKVVNETSKKVKRYRAD